MIRNETIKLSVGDIRISIDNQGCGNIASSLKDDCPYCKRFDCNMHCAESNYAIEPRESLQDIKTRFLWNSKCDAVECLILSHACAGVNVGSPEYVEGLETAIETMSNNI